MSQVLQKLQPIGEGRKKQLSTFSFLLSKYVLVENPKASPCRLHMKIKFPDG